MYCSLFFFFKQKTAYEMRISDWSSDVCSSDLVRALEPHVGAARIEVISNGSNADNEFAQELWTTLEPKFPGITVCTTIQDPSDLIQKIGSYRDLEIGRASCRGKRVSVRVDHGGRVNMKQTTQKDLKSIK